MTLSRESLEDLYKAGAEYDVSPDGDGTAMIYVRKLGPTQQSTAVQKANAEKVKVQLRLDTPEDMVMIELYREVAELEREEKIEQLSMASVAEERQKIEQEISEEEKWMEDGTLQALVDAWEGGLLEDYLKGEEERSEESVRVFTKMKEFTDKVDTKLQGRVREARVEFERFSDEVLNRKMVEAQVDYEASLAWMRTFRMYQIMYGVHNKEREPMYESIAAVETIPAELFAKFVEKILDLSLPTVEVKS